MYACKFMFLLPILTLGITVLGQPNPLAVDHYRLVLTWPKGHCSTGSICKTHLPQKLVLHGLWPVDSEGRSLTFCGPQGTSIPKLGVKLQQLMNAKWPSIGIKFHDNKAFWLHEWNKHGTCCQGLAMIDYFKDTITLMNTFGVPIDLALKSQIGTGKSAGEAVFVSAIQNVTHNVPPVLQCKKGNLLSEITICVAQDLQTVIPCNAGTTRYRKCKATITLP